MHRKKHLRGEITIPGDKSISHRGIMLGSLAEGDTHLHGFLEGADCLSSIACFQKMGIEIATSTAMIATTISNSASVKPFLFIFFNILTSSLGVRWSFVTN